MVFLIKDTLTVEDRAAWRRLAVQRERHACGGYRILMILWLTMKLLGLFLLVSGGLALYLCGTSFKDKRILKGMLYTAMGLIYSMGGIWLFLRLRNPPIRPRRLPKEDFPPSGMPDMPVRAVFFEDGSFTFWEASEKVRLGYQAVDSVWEDSGCFYLFFRERPPLVLPKRGLGRQGPEGFRRFLERTIGKPMMWAGRHPKNDKEQDTE